MTPLSALDALFLHLETPATPMHVGGLHRLRAPRDRAGYLERLRAVVASRLHLAPPFTRQLMTMPLEFADPVWIEAPTVNVAWHIRRVRLPRPGSDAQLHALVARLQARLLDRSRPLWRMTLIEGLASGELALFTQFHHATLDGAAGVLLGQALLDVTARPRRVPPPSDEPPEPLPGTLRLAATGLASSARKTARLARGLPSLAKTVAATVGLLAQPAARVRLARNLGLGPATPLNRAITPARRVATLSLPLAAVKVVARARGVTLNDVVLAIVAGGLREYLQAHQALPRKPLVAAIPVSLRASGDSAFSTLATMTLTGLATDRADPLERLARVHEAAGAAKALTGSLRGLIPTDLPSLGLPWLLSAGAALYARASAGEHLPPIANLVVSNVPGPPVPLYLAGARVLTWWPMSIVEHGLGLNITLMSYAGSLDFGLVAARDAVPDLDRLTQALARSWAALEAATAAAAEA
jgi:WS/DGAT/MGAT family acyltransferase